MAQASIPVDLVNPGQVFACMGFLEAADVLVGEAEGGFDWTDAEPGFTIRVDGTQDPFETVLEFLATAEIRSCGPPGQKPPPTTNDRSETTSPDDSEEAAAAMAPEVLDTFPASRGEPRAWPVRLGGLPGERHPGLWLSHWADGSTRIDFKLYAGNRSAEEIVRAMLRGTARKGSRKGAQRGRIATRGVAHLWEERRSDLLRSPFHVLTPMRGSFNFDPRRAWNAIDAGYSPDNQGHSIEASPVVEILAAAGLEHSRPAEPEPRDVRYAVWQGLLPLVLARPALAGVRVVTPMRGFRFTLGRPGKNQAAVTFAREESTP